MNSLRRPHHIHLHDLREFMHKYDPVSKDAPEDWARQASAGLKHGSLFFLLEPVATPFSLTSFTRKEDDENFRVTELAMIVRLEDNKAMALSAASNHYELRYLQVLLEEKARKARIDQRKFYFVLAKPVLPLGLNKISEVEKLSNLYAQGGSRRDFLSEKGDPTQEPVIAILAACGAHLHSPDSSKQLLDLGSICYLLFTPEGRQPDSNRSELKANFVPVQPSSGGTTIGGYSPPLQSDNTEGDEKFNILNTWGQMPPSTEIAASSGLFKRISDELAKKQPQQDDPLSLVHLPAEDESVSPLLSTTSDIEEEKIAEPTIAQQEKVVEAKTDTKDEVYHHISEALSGLLDTEMDLKQPPKADRSAQWVASQIEAHREEIEQKRGIDKRNQLSDKLAENTPVQEEPIIAKEELKLESQVLAPELESTAPVDFALLGSITTGGQAIVFPASGSVPTKLDDFQEPKVVMNEMASLMHKLESQVARAAKKLTSRTASIEQQLTTSMAAMLSTITQENKDTEAQLVIHGDSLSKQFESLFESLKTEMAEKSASAREQIQAKHTEQQKLIEKSEHEHHKIFSATLNQNQTQFGQLVQDQETQLKNRVKEETEKLHKQMTDINLSLQTITDKSAENLSEQLNGFEKRIDEEMSVILESLDNNTHILSKNIMISCHSGLEKLKKIKSEFEANLKCLVEITEIALDRQIKIAQIEFFLPRLKEHKQLVETMMQEMEETFAEKLLSQSRAQLDGLASSLASAQTQLQGLMDECLTKLDLIGRNQQSGLEELFATAANSLGKNTDDLMRMLNKAEQEITDSDAVCKKLAETYSLDNDPAVISLRQNISNKVDSLKAEVKGELESAVNNDCAALENLIRNQHSKLNSRRAELAQQVHLASDQGLQRIRAAIHDTFNAIQSEREKYME